MLVNLQSAELNQDFEPPRAESRCLSAGSSTNENDAPALPSGRRVGFVMDFLNVSVAGMRDGVGPLLTLFLVRSVHLSPTNLATTLAAPSLGCLLAQVPAGVLYDKIADKRKLVILGALLMALGGLLMSRSHSFVAILMLQTLCGIAMCLISVGIPALSFASSGKEGLGKRLARNEIFSKIGNFSAIAITGFLTQALGLYWIFYVLAFFAGMTALTTTGLKTAEGPTKVADNIRFRTRLVEALKTPGFIGLVALSFVFQFSNASMFMIFEQAYARAHTDGPSVISSAVFLTQIVITCGSLMIALRGARISTLAYFKIGFSLIAVRGLIFALGLNLVSLGTGQVLDGLIAAIIIIVPVRTLGSLAKGNFNILTSLLGTCVSLGAALSTLFAGFMIKNVGERLSYVTFGSAAALALVIVGIRGLLKERKAAHKAHGAESSPSRHPYESVRERAPFAQAPKMVSR